MQVYRLVPPHAAGVLAGERSRADGLSWIGASVPSVVLVLPANDDASALKDFLNREGFAVECEADAERVKERTEALQSGIIVLDITSGSPDGLEALRDLRLRSALPVLVVTEPFDWEKRISAMELGADACVGKPWDSHELAARIRAVLRRCVPPSGAGPRRLMASGVVLDPGTREVFMEAKEISLTTIEFDVLEILMRSAGRPVSRDAVIRKLYNRDATGFDRSVNMHISNLRKKLESGMTLIKAVRGTGYQFCIAAVVESVPASPSGRAFGFVDA